MATMNDCKKRLEKNILYLSVAMFLTLESFGLGEEGVS